MKARLKERNYYQILGLERNATSAEIKRAYRKLAQEHHPDRKGKARSEEFVQIKEAYEVLSDPERCRKYRRYGDPDFNEELMSRLQAEAGPAGHPFYRFALKFHYKRMVDTGCPKCSGMEKCNAWRERLQAINCPKKRKP